MIKKTYKSNTNISINVVLKTKKSLHISFTPLSNGSSVFTTDNEDVQNAIEQHYKYGKLFKLQSSQGQSTVKPTETDAAGQDDDAETQSEDAGASDESTSTDTMKTVKVSDLASAKDYLADTFGISRTILRSKKAIEEQAAAHGIVFEGLS